MAKKHKHELAVFAHFEAQTPTAAPKLLAFFVLHFGDLWAPLCANLGHLAITISSILVKMGDPKWYAGSGGAPLWR